MEKIEQFTRRGPIFINQIISYYQRKRIELEVFK